MFLLLTLFFLSLSSFCCFVLVSVSPFFWQNLVSATGLNVSTGNRQTTLPCWGPSRTQNTQYRTGNDAIPTLSVDFPSIRRPGNNFLSIFPTGCGRLGTIDSACGIIADFFSRRKHLRIYSCRERNLKGFICVFSSLGGSEKTDAEWIFLSGWYGSNRMKQSKSGLGVWGIASLVRTNQNNGKHFGSVGLVSRLVRTSPKKKRGKLLARTSQNKGSSFGSAGIVFACTNKSEQRS